MNKEQSKRPLPTGWHSYDLEVIKFIDHLELMLPAIRQHYIDAVELQDISVKAVQLDEIMTIASGIPADPVGMVATDPRRKARRDYMTKTRSLIKKVHSLTQEALHYSAKGAIL